MRGFPGLLTVEKAAVLESNFKKGPFMLLKHRNGLWRCYASEMAPSWVLDQAGSFLQRDLAHRVMNLSRIREVLWVELPGREPVVLKRYLPVGFPRALWNTLRGTQWRREWDTSVLLSQMGVLAPKPLLFGERLEKGMPTEGLVVSQAIQGARSLTQELQGSKQKRSSFLEALAVFLAQIHAMGILHRDLHGENLLVGKTPEGGPIFWLLDLHRVRIGRPLGDRQRKWNLAQILTSLRRELLAGEERLLMEAYLGAYSAKDSCEPWLESIQKTRAKMLSKHQRSRTRRCLKESSGFARESLPGGRVIRKRDFPMEAVLKALDQGRACQTSGDFKLLKLSGPTRVCELHFDLQGKAFSVCVKEHILRGPIWNLLKGILPSRARRFWVGAWGMSVRDFRVPTPMAMWEVYAEGIFSSGVLMELIQDGSRMDHVAASLGSDWPSRRLLIKELAFTLARMHSEGIFHRDLKATNLMVRKTQDKMEILFLDLEDISFGKRVPRNKVLLNLAQLDASLPESVGGFSRLRFLRTYLGKNHSKEEIRNLIQEVRRLSLQRRAGA